MQAGDRIGGRYVVERELGVGAAGRVYRAVDIRTQRPVALKLLNADAVTAAAIERAGLLALEHPALVRMLDSGSHEGQAYVVSELVTGGSLTSLPKPVTPEVLEQLAAQMLGALAFLHGQGILHADVKTENIFIDSTTPPRFKLGDFGLSRRIKDLGASAAAGSPAFMPPEVIRGEPVDERGDLYSLGVVLYECAFGRLPFDAASVSAVFLGHLNDEPEGLRNPGAVRPREVALLKRLLAKDPAARPRDARAALTAWRGEEAAVPDSALPRLGVLIGREAELAACEQALSGPGRILVLEGPSGVGKTRLLHELAVRARLENLRVAWWTPDNVRGDRVDLPMDSTTVGEFDKGALTDRCDWALGGTSALQAELGPEGWVLIADDLDAAPAWFVQSVDELCRAALASPASRVLVCVACRSSLLQLEQTVLDAPADRVLRLYPQNWPVDDVTAALSALYGTRAIDPLLASFVLEATGGNPALVERIAPRLVARHALRATPTGQLTITASATAQDWNDFPETWFDESIRHLTPDERKLLQLLSAIRVPADPSMLQLLRPNMDGSLAVLVRAGLVRAVPGAGAPHFMTAGEALRRRALADLSHDQIAELHSEVSAALERTHASESDVIVYHRAMCAHANDLIATLEELGRSASPETLRRVHDFVAARFANQLETGASARFALLRLDALYRAGDVTALRTVASAALGTCPEQFRGRVGCYLAEAYLELGEPEHALDALASLNAAEDPEIAARVGRALWMMRRYEEGLAVTRRALAGIGPGMASAHNLVAVHTTLLRGLGRIDEALGLAISAADAARAAGALRDLAHLLLNIGQTYFYRGDFASAEANYREATDVLAAIGDRFGLLRAFNSLAAAAGELGRYMESREHLLRAIDLSRSLGEFRTLSTLYTNFALLSHLLGCYSAALQHVHLARRLLDRMPNHNTAHAARLIETMILIRLGDYSSARSTIEWVLHDSPDALATAQSHILEAEVCRSLEEYDAADAALDAAAPILLHEGAVDEVIELDLSRARNAAARGAMETALALADAVLERTSSGGGWLPTVQSQALLAEIAAHFDPEVAAALAVESLAVVEANSLREEAWRLHRVLGMCSQRRGDAAGCRANFQRAWQTIEEILADMPGEFVASYLRTPDVREFIVQIDAELAGFPSAH